MDQGIRDFIRASEELDRILWGLEDKTGEDELLSQARRHKMVLTRVFLESKVAEYDKIHRLLDNPPT